MTAGKHLLECREGPGVHKVGSTPTARCKQIKDSGKDAGDRLAKQV